MESEDSTIIFALLVCLAVALIGLYLRSEPDSDPDYGPEPVQLLSQPDQAATLD